MRSNAEPRFSRMYLIVFFFGERDQSTWVTLLQFDIAMEEDPFSSMV